MDAKDVKKNFLPKEQYQKSQIRQQHPYFRSLSLTPFHKELNQEFYVFLCVIQLEYQEKESFLMLQAQLNEIN